MFFNASVVFHFSLSSSLYAERKDLLDLDISPQNSINIGLGYNYKNKYNFELRSGVGQEIIGGNLSWSSDYNDFLIIFGYTIF